MFEMLFSRKKRYYYVTEEKNVTTVLDVINSEQKWRTDQNLRVGNCGWADDKTQWFIHFDATGKQITAIIKKLNEKFKMEIKDQPDRVYLVRKEES